MARSSAGRSSAVCTALRVLQGDVEQRAGGCYPSNAGAPLYRCGRNRTASRASRRLTVCVGGKHAELASGRARGGGAGGCWRQGETNGDKYCVEARRTAVKKRTAARVY